MKLLTLDVLLPKVYNEAAPKKSPDDGDCVELNALLLDERVARVVGLLKAGDMVAATAIVDDMAEEMHMQSCGLRLAWTQLVRMWMLSERGEYADVVADGIDTLRTLVNTDDRSSIEYLSMVASAIYLLALAHYSMGENRKAERELDKAQKLYERLAKKDGERFTPALMMAVEASTEVYKSKLKKMNVLAHYQVATELYQGKVSAGVTEAIGSLVDSITAEGDIHLKMGNYRDAVKFYTKALRYQKRVSASMGHKELRISINLGQALLHLANRRAAGEQLLRSVLPLAERMDAVAEAEEIKTLLADQEKSTFDIMSLWKKLF